MADADETAPTAPSEPPTTALSGEPGDGAGEAPAKPSATAGQADEENDPADVPAEPRAEVNAAAGAAAGEAADGTDAPAAAGAAAPEGGEEETGAAPAEPKASATAAARRPDAADDTAEPADDTAVSGRARLKLHHLRPAPGAHRAKTRVGRGEASKGKTAGRGTKGTKARGTVPTRFEGGQMPLHRRVPKQRGFSNLRFKTTYQVVNLDRLAALYPQGGEVTPDDLAARGAVRKGELVKVLGTGEVGIALRVTAHAFSASAKEKITAAGGSATEV